MVRTKYLAAMVAAVLTVFATGCIVGVEPRTAVNPVGTEHTVTVTLRDPEEFDEEAICNVLTDVFEELEDIEEFEEFPPIINPCETQVSLDTAQEDDIVEFFVVSGPNQGTNSHDDGECEPSCSDLPDDLRISWTYRSNGIPGTDVIEVCADTFFALPPVSGEELQASQLTEEELLELIQQIFIDAVNEEFGTDFENEEEFRCQQVTKTWQEPQRPNIGAGLSGLFAGQPTALPTAPAPAAVAPSTTIRPPSTGDAGLK